MSIPISGPTLLSSRSLAAVLVRPQVQLAPAPAAPARVAALGASPVPPIVLHSATVATIDPALIRLRLPDFGLFAPPPVPRSALALPTLVSPVPAPDAGTLLEEPQDPSRRHYLPRYALATVVGPSGRAKWVSLAATDTGVTLTVHLAEATDPAVSGAAARVDAATRYFVSAAVGGRQLEWDLTAAAASPGASLTLTSDIADLAVRDQLYQAMTDPAAGARLVVRASLPLALPLPNDPAQYRAGTSAVDGFVPFTFSKELDAGVFAAAGGAPTAPAKYWNVLTRNWGGRSHTYFQSRTRPGSIYFLPDAFKVMRQDEPPHAPALSVTAAGDDAASMQLTLSYLARPVWDPKRVQDAADAFQADLSLPAAPDLALFDAAGATLALTVPGGAGAGAAALVEQAGAIVDFAGGVHGALTLALPAFRQVYDALFDQVSTLLAGEVRVLVEGTLATVPFVARADDFAGTVLAQANAVDASAGTLVCTITNALESPVRVDALRGAVVKGSAAVPSELRGVAPALPVTLAPASAPSAAAPTDPSPADPAPAGSASLTATFAVTPGDALAESAAAAIGKLLSGGSPDASDATHAASGVVAAASLDATCTALFDLSDVHVLPDPTAIWRAILQGESLTPISRSVQVRAFAAMLRPPSPPPADSVVALQVVFDSGQTASFDASQTPDAAGFLTQTVRLVVPVDAYVLGSSDTSSYQYRVDRVTASGIQAGDWVSDNRDMLFVSGG